MSIFKAILAISAGLIGIVTWFLNLFSTRAVQKAEDQKIENVVLKTELSNVQKADSARNAVTDDANSILHDPNRI